MRPVAKRVAGWSAGLGAVLLAGVAANVGTAWGCALWSRVRWAEDPWTRLASDAWPVTRPYGWPNPGFQAIGRGWGISGLQVTDRDPGTPWGFRGPASVPPPPVAPGAEMVFGRYAALGGKTATRVRFGWPCRSMQILVCRPRVEVVVPELLVEPLREPARFRPDEGMELPPFARSAARDIDRRVPLVPVWTGFIANSGLFAGLAAVACMGFGTARAIRRRIRGFCVRCAYPVGRSVRCPECGHGVRRCAVRRPARSTGNTEEPESASIH